MNPAIFGILTSFLPLLLLIGIIAVVVTANRHRVHEDEPGIGTIRRLLGYGASLAGLALLVAGASLLLRIVLGTAVGDENISGEATTLALALALTVVGGPVWFGAWLLMDRVASTHPVEIRTVSRKAYLHLVLAGTALASAISATFFLSSIGRDGEPFDETTLSIAIFTALVWAYHWRIEQRDGQLNVVTATVRRFYVYGLSLTGVVLAVIGVGSGLTILMRTAYDAILSDAALISGDSRLWSQAMQLAVAEAFVGGVVAWWHWLRAAKGDAGSWMRSVYLYPVAILGGAVAVVSSSSVGLYHVLQWWFGDPDTASATDHFDIFPGLIAIVLVGAAVWVYHWQVAREEAAADESATESANRIYNYIVSALGVATLAVGISMLFQLLIGLISPSGQPNLRGELWRNPLALTLTLLAVGTPTWLWSWRQVQGAVVRIGARERDALSRRIFIYGTFGVALIATLVNLSIVLFNVFEALLGEREWGRLLWDSRWSIAVLLTAGVATSYFWQVLREDRAVLGTVVVAERPAVVRKAVTVLAGPGGGELVARIEQALGYQVEAWRGSDGLAAVSGGEDAEIERAVEEVGRAPTEQVLVIAEGSGLRVLPYEA